MPPDVPATIFAPCPGETPFRSPHSPRVTFSSTPIFPSSIRAFPAVHASEEDAMVHAASRGNSRASLLSTPGRPIVRCSRLPMRLARHFHGRTIRAAPTPFRERRLLRWTCRAAEFEVRQEGTSLEWISGARLLIHQNCSTAIEATMLEVEPLSMEWFNTPALRLEAASRVSRGCRLRSRIDRPGAARARRTIARCWPRKPCEFRRRIISDLFTAVDGASAARVTDAVLATIEAARRGRPASAPPPWPSVRGLLAQAVRRTLGHKASSALRRACGSSEDERRRLGKAFAPDAVNLVLRRINGASAEKKNFVAQRATGRSRWTARAMSGSSLQLTEAI